MNVKTHENERTKLPQRVERLAVNEVLSWSEQHIFCTVTSFLYTMFHWSKSTSRRRAISPLILHRDLLWTAESSSDGARCLEGASSGLYICMNSILSMRVSGMWLKSLYWAFYSLFFGTLTSCRFWMWNMNVFLRIYHIVDSKGLHTRVL